MKHYPIIGVLLIIDLNAPDNIRKPVPFLPDIISVPGMFSGTTFLPDGNTVYYTSSEYKTNNMGL